MIESKKVNKILYGGDYNPEQWPEEIWEEDMRMFKLAHIDVVTLNVFSWAAYSRMRPPMISQNWIRSWSM